MDKYIYIYISNNVFIEKVRDLKQFFKKNQNCKFVFGHYSVKTS